MAQRCQSIGQARLRQPRPPPATPSPPPSDRRPPAGPGGARRSAGGSAAAASARPPAWFPESRTSGTVRPRNSAGRVYGGASRSPSANDSSPAESGEPRAPRNVPNNRIDEHHRRQLASGEDVVADAHFVRRQMLVHASVDSLVVPSDDDQTRRDRQLERQVVVELPADRRHEDDRPPFRRLFRAPLRLIRRPARASAPCPGRRRRRNRRQPCGGPSPTAECRGYGSRRRRRRRRA